MKRFSGGMELRRRVAVPIREEHPTLPMEERLYAESAEAVALVGLRSRTIIDSNPRAATLLGRIRPALVGARFDALFTLDSRDAIVAGITAAMSSGHTSIRWVCAAAGRGFLDLRVSLVRNGSDSHLLVHLQESDRADNPARIAVPDSSVFTLLDEISDAFFVTDHHLRLMYANRAFAMMTGKPRSEALQGNSITQWLDLTQSDLDSLATQMLQRQGVQFLRTRWLRTAGAGRDVLLCAIAVPDGHAACWGFRVCDIRESIAPI